MQRLGGGELEGSQTHEHDVAGEPEEEVGVRLLEGERHELGVSEMSSPRSTSAPPSKAPRTVSPSMAGKRSNSGVEFDTGDLV
ncbi:hypothetical protein NB231_06171 [Nitrococcus mobilis Nb-231]|uniref:Uncharacterized protein n=2 Tax=Nitrococcus mobilis TaxID=35797 RepID=A4BQV1_9GAMM|nr:hypothetical protein NB231_06171 [Nitrococcus mobilis Nb-231]